MHTYLSCMHEHVSVHHAMQSSTFHDALIKYKDCLLKLILSQLCNPTPAALSSCGFTLTQQCDAITNMNQAHTHTLCKLATNFGGVQPGSLDGKALL